MDRRRGHEGWRGDHRPDPAPFPADDGTPSRLRTINIASSCALKTVRVEGTGGARPGKCNGHRPADDAPGNHRLPPPVGHRWTIGRRRGGNGRVKRWAAAASLAPWRTCQNADVQRDRGTRAIADRMPGMGDPRPAVGRGRMMALGKFDVCSNAAVNSDLSCFLYTL